MVDYSTSSVPLLGRERKPNSCGPCGAFKKIGEEYHPPTTHFWHCEHFIDQGVIRTVGIAPAPKQQRERRRAA